MRDTRSLPHPSPLPSGRGEKASKMKIIKKDWRLMSQRQRMSPFPNYMSMEAVTGRMKKYLGASLASILLIFEDRLMNAFNPKKDFEQAGDFIMRKIRKDPRMYARLIQLQDKFGKKLVKFAKSAGSKAPISGAAQLAKFFAVYNELYLDVYATYGSVWVVENVLNFALLDIVKKRVPDESEAMKLLNTLTLQPSAMVARIEREALFALAARIAGRPAWRKQVLNSDIIDSRLTQAIKIHEKEYFWVTRDYEDAVLNFDGILSKLKDCLKKNPVKVYKQMVAERKAVSVKQKQISEKLKLSGREKALFQTMLDVAHLKELRKRYVSESLYYFDPVLVEIGKRASLSLKQVRFLRTADIKEILLKNKDFTREVNERIKLSAWLTDDNGNTRVFTGKDALAYKKALVDYSPNAREFVGFPVSPGIARGPVKIIMNPDEINKVKKGDVIVSVQVVPSFSSAIHRAAALICDGGHGVTTHPAILAREAKIPAIIQTSYARHVLKDGDMVEVDGFKGIAKKLD